MKRKGLYFLIALALGGMSAVHAQDNTSSGAPATSSYDSRWYIAPTVGGYYNDSDRATNSRQFYYGLGVGRYFSPNFSLDIFYDRTRRTVDGYNGGGRWTDNNGGIAGRYYFGDWNAWRPYILGGVLGSHHTNPYDRSWSPAAELGVGLSKTITASTDFRIEAGYRYDWDDKSSDPANNYRAAEFEGRPYLRRVDGYGDYFLGLSIVARLGEPAAAPAPAPAPQVDDCSKHDDDNDGVNNCLDKCPGTPAGTIVGPDGCPQKVVIDLRGVNFKFDRPKRGEKNIRPTLAEPTADSIAILDQAVDTLQRYPNVGVVVAGYTDSIGTDKYNQGLSERRAAIVYNYLTSHGIDASRLQGPTGHGENDPIDTNKTSAGRARNRRTELQVQQ